MDNTSRKQAIADWKRRDHPVGVYAVRCNATGAVWVGASRTLDKVENKLWFTLRMGGGRPAALQRAWSAHGAESIRFEELERLDESVEPVARERVLKEKRDSWRARLGAEAM